MKKTILKIICLTFLLSTGAPAISHAYEMTDARAVRLNDDFALFTVSYRFGFLNRSTYVPIQSQRSDATTPTAVTYVLKADGATTTSGVSSSLVLSNTTVRDGRYFIPQGRNGFFTLMSIVRLDAAAQAAGDLTLHITNIPVVVSGEDAVEQLLAIDTAAFTTYRTPPLR